MKQATKKASDVKATAPKTANTIKDSKAVKVDTLHVQKTNQLNRFLEASCDCV